MLSGVAWRLSVMMFLEYVIWGSWLPLLSLYLTRSLHLSGAEIGWIFATQAIASVTALFVSGQIADRYLRTDRFLALSHLVGGLSMLALAYQRTFWSFFLIMLVHSLAYVPTLSLTNSICFHHLKDAQKEFGRVRLWGTIGWIAASWPFVFILKGKEGAAMDAALGSIFVVAGLASLALAAFSLALPPDAALDAGRGEERDLRRHPAPRGAEHPRAVRGDLPRRRRASVLLLLDRSLPRPRSAFPRT